MDSTLRVTGVEDASFVAVLRRSAEEAPQRLAYRFVDATGQAESELTYGELDTRARATGALLAERGIAGERAVLLYPPGEEYVVGYLGCLYGGAVAVPAYPPRQNRNLPRLLAILRDAEPAAILTTSDLVERLRRWGAEVPELAGIQLLATDDRRQEAARAAAWQDPDAEPSTLAFLQYTSGSTGTPKGVMVSHGNLLANSRLIQQAFGTTEQDRVVSWLPPYHDMGLIGGILQPLFARFPATLLPPVTFLQQPALWLELISRERATISGGPNFAYDLVARRMTEAQRQELDLSSWGVAFNGAEPVRAETLQRFAETFASQGFSPRAFYPCYGLAEATLFVTGGDRETTPLVSSFDRTALRQHRAASAPEPGADGAATLVSSGHGAAGQRLLVVDPETLQPVDPGTVGEVWIAGSSVAAGYWKRPEATAETFGARLASGEAETFLRTGDLGFFGGPSGEDLFVTGRRKDLIIIRGRNHYPQDLERTAEEATEGLRAGCGAAFSVEAIEAVGDGEDGGGEERLVIVYEVDRHSEATKPEGAERVMEAVRRAVAENHEVGVHEVVLVRIATVPKTSSGKIQRSACRDLYLRDELTVVARSALATAAVAQEAGPDPEPADILAAPPEEQRRLVAEFLRREAAHLVRRPVSQLPLDQPLTGVGLDSLLSVEFQHAVETRLGVAPALVSLLGGASVEGLTDEVLEALAGSTVGPDAASAIDPAAARFTPVAEGPETGEFPLSPGQRALWFLDRLDPAAAAYNIVAAARVDGLDPEALERSFQLLSRRHPALRTTFRARSGEPYLHVAATGSVDFRVEEAIPGEAMPVLRRRMTVAAFRPFDLEQGPLLRLRLFPIGTGDEGPSGESTTGGYAVVLAVHHLVADLWSVAVLLRELAVVYRLEMQREAPPEGGAGSWGESLSLLPPLEVRATDHAQAQRRLLEGPQGAVLEAYWRQRLEDPAVLAPLELPTDRPRPPVQRYRGALASLPLPQSVAAALNTLAGHHGSTLFTALLAAFQVLLHRYSGQRHILVGAPTANRESAAVAGVVGYFVNPVVVAGDLGDDPSFADFLEALRDTTLAAFAHGAYPFPRLVEKLQPVRDPSRSPIFQVLFALQRAPGFEGSALGAFAMGQEGARLRLTEGLELHSLPLGERRAQFDLSLLAAEVDDSVTLALEYNTALFDPGTAERFLGHLAVLLGAVGSDPQQAISRVGLLTPAERDQLVAVWNDTAVPYPDGVCLHELFEAQAAAKPEATALVWGEERWSYRALDAAAAALAVRLRRRGVGPEVRVAVLLERTSKLVVSLLAVLKAGGVYVPLDPSYPEERQRWILEDAAVAVLITEPGPAAEALGSVVPAANTLLLEGALPEDEGVELTRSAVGPHHLAYLIYTSGSTGRPKAVAIEHHSPVALVSWARAAYSPDELEGVLAATSVCFDLSIFELFVPLASGGMVVLVDDALALLEGAARVPALEAVSLINTVPSAMRELVRLGKVPDSVITVNLAGEPLPGVLVDGIHETTAVHRVFNLYGPSEDTTYSTGAVIPKRGERGGREPSIGRPLPNGRAYVLDRHGEPTPVGVPGELYLGGAGVARGYLGRPALTAERFVPDPFTTGALGAPGSVDAIGGDRLYRTGDRARFRASGDLDFLGRLDHQIKLRGFRIELGEVEAALAALPEIREAVAMVREDIPGDPRLVAYGVLESPSTDSADSAEAAVDLDALKDRLGARLPEYMVPAAFVLLEALPLTPNGKVDRKRLPAPEVGSTVAFEAPAHPVEELLAAIWCEVLGVERVGRHDDFFALGGHSLLATQVLARITERLRLELPLSTLFEAPTLAALGRRVGAALATPGTAGADGEATVAALRSTQDGAAAELPLSFAQQRLWFLDQLESGSPFYNLPLAYRLRGTLDLGAFEAAFAEIVRRHEALRTRFPAQDGRPRQVIEAPGGFSMTVVDLAAPGEAPAGMEQTRLRLARLTRLTRKEAQRPFDLARGPLLRVTVARLGEVEGEPEHAVLVTVHHIVGDGWSMGVLLEELSALYGAFLKGEPSPLPALPIQYTDFAAWQRRWLEGERLEADLEYWRRRLEGAPPALDLPTDRPRPATQSYRGARIPVRLAERPALAERAREHGATLYMVLLAGFATLLHRYTGDTDLVVGTPVANRHRVEVEGLIGFFANTLALRIESAPHATFSELLQRVRQVTLEAQAHQDLPFERLVEELAPQRDLSRSPIFQVLFVMQNAPRQTPTLPGLTLVPLEVDTGTAKFDLTLSLEENGQEGWLEYSTDLFDPATMERLLDHYQRLLAAVTDPENTAQRALDALPMLSAAEHQQVMAWGQGGPASSSTTVLEAVYRQAEATPEAPALRYEDRVLTFAEVSAAGRRLAAILRRRGAGSGSVVGLFLERGLEAPMAVLGILSSGAAYLPLDPAYPDQRLALMLQDAACSLAVTQGDLVARLPGGVAAVDAGDLLSAGEGAAAPVASPGALELAYVIYTSGSTGEPKGIALGHGVLSNMVDWYGAQLRGAATGGPLGPALQFASIGFDVSFMEIFAAWCGGGELVMVGEEARRDMAALAALIQRQKVETAIVPVVVLHCLAEEWAELEAGQLPLRRLIATGEQLTVTPAVRTLFRRHTDLTLHNYYGPSEAHVVTALTLPPDAGLWPSAPSIGRPIAGAEIRILNSLGAPQPVGVPGELAIGGVTLARGYQGRSAETAAVFVPDPFGQSGAGDRLYRSGDQARWRADGTVEFLGRRDTQLKIRGFRVEPGEVEAVLDSHPAVRDAAVVAWESGEPNAGGRRLVAYVVPEGGSLDELGELRGYLHRRLPEHMVPSAFVQLERLPLNRNGKLDRSALPAPEGGLGRPDYVAPRTVLEQVVAEVWEEVLGVERVGVEDGFFEMGGHSLIATQAISRLRRRLGVALPLKALFENPTVATFSLRLEAALGQGAVESRIRRHRETTQLPLSYSQQRLWFLDQLESGSAFYNVAGAYRLRGALSVVTLERTFREVVRRHEALRTHFEAHDGRPTQVIEPERDLALRVVDLSTLSPAAGEAECWRGAHREARRPFDLAHGPLLRVTVVRLASGGLEDAGDHVALITLHHIVGDGWSLGVLLREVSILYGAFLDGGASPLPDLPIQYVDFAAWQRRRLEGERLRAEVDHWRERLDGAPAALDLPTDRPRPTLQSYRGARLGVLLPETLAEDLGALARHHGATPYMVLLAGFVALLHRYTGERDLVVGTPVANRHRVEVENLIGFFANTLALRLDFPPGATFGALLERVRAVTLEAQEHQDLPFERLVEALAPRRDLSRSPIFQVLFVMQNAPHQEPSLAGLAVTSVALDPGTARCDLTLSLDEDGRQGWLEYATDLFDGATMERFLGHYQRLLAAVVRPDGLRREIDRLPMLHPAERRQLLDWGTGPVGSAETSVLEIFQRVALATPEAPALRCGEEVWSYRRVDAVARQLAAALRQRGAGRSGVGGREVVGLFLERGAAAPVAVLAILATGTAYLPLDPAYPDDRLALMFEDAGCGLVVTSGRLASRLPRGVEAVDVGPLLTDEGASAPPMTLPPSAAAAYVMYTSGSTGRPKGITLSHGALANLVRWYTGVVRARSGDGPMLQYASIGFDVSFMEIFGAWGTGSELVMVGEEQRQDMAALAALIGRHGVATAIVPVVVLHCLAEEWLELGEEELPRRLHGLRLLIATGEQLTITPAVRELFRRHPQLELHNDYGPSETHVVSALTLPSSPDRWPVAPAIGGPIDGVTLRIVDAQGALQPLGVPGELAIGGLALARGYLGQPAQTAALFVPDPFAAPGPGEGGGRLYRSGDLARWRADGTVEFLGRRDGQLKIRGFRVEPGEVEAVLGSQAAVRDAVVLPWGEAEEKRLVAYLVPEPPERGDAEIDLAGLRASLRRRLPEHMVPSAFVLLDRLPLNTNGKLDRAALPGPDMGAHWAQYVAPSTVFEQVVATLWGEVLGLEKVGAEDDFFDLGGHSLLATQVVSRLRRSLGVELPLRTLFECPTVAGFAARVEEARGRDSATTSQAMITPRPPGGGNPPLSFAQQRLWFLDQLESGSAFYNVPGAYRLRGALVPWVLERTFQAVVDRHEALRTRFPAVDGEPRQEILERLPFTVPMVDLSGLDTTEREAELSRLAQGEARRTFDLERGPLMRVNLLRLQTAPAEAEHAALVNLHHIVSDGWSLGVLIREVAVLYEAFASGMGGADGADLSGPGALPPLPVQYGDYAAWQRRWLAGERLEQELEHWRQCLTGAPPVLDLPTDRPRPPVQSYRGAKLPVVLPRALSRRVGEVARGFGVTPFMVLQAAYDTLLYRYTRETDLMVGSPVANRDRLEIEGLIGFFVNTLPLRVDLSGSPAFAELVARVRRVTLDAYAHQDVPFEKLVEELAPQRDLAHAPLFQVLFVLQNAPRGEIAVGGLELTPVPFDTGTSKFDLTLSLEEREGRLEGWWEYATDLFDDATLERLSGHFQVLLEGAVMAPETPLDRLPLVTNAERRQLLVEWNDTEREEPLSTVVPWFERQVAATPEAPAVVFRPEAPVSYGELNARANRLARALVRRGVGRDTAVGICLERGLAMVTAVVAIYKAGGAYVPLDPAYPEERLGFMLEEAACPVLLTQESLREALPTDALAAMEVLLLDDPAWFPEESNDNLGPAQAPAPENLGYIIYTSGSTGRPKGIALSHGALANLIEWHRETMLTGARMLGFASLSFDASFHEYFATWCSGGTLYLVPEALRRDVSALTRFLSEERIEKVILPVVVLQRLAEEWSEVADGDGDDGARTVALKELTTTGEALYITPPVVALFERHPEIVFHNHYGPSETHVVTALTLPPASRRVGERSGAAAWPSHPSIGFPIARTTIYILNRALEPTPVGVPGDLYIGGVSLARGYIHQPGLTAERFIPDPFAPAAVGGGGRLYATGDLARYQRNGEIEFLGRLDHQVKIRGFRIEPAEIEAVLTEHPQVHDAAVIPVESAGEKRLVAYLVVSQGSAPEPAAVRAYLAERMPEYMIPAAYVLLDAFPLTANGKLDRKALPAPEGVRGTAEGEYVAPRTATEEILVGLWAALLGVTDTSPAEGEAGKIPPREQIGVEDNFFQLGGHSLLATRLVSRIRAAFGVEMPLAEVFKKPTIAGQGAWVDAARREGAGLTAPPIEPLDWTARPDAPPPLSFAQERLWLLDRLFPDSAVYNLSQALELVGPLDVAAFEAAFRTVAERHEVLRTVFGVRDELPVQLIAPGPQLHLRVVDLSGLASSDLEPAVAEARRLAADEAGQGFNLERGPLLRLRLLRLRPDHHALVLNMHHVVGDDWSIQILVREVAEAYQSHRRGVPSSLPLPPIQYADYAAWQRRYLADEILDRQMDFWLGQLSGELPVLRLPTDHPRPKVRKFLGDTVEFQLEPEVAAGVRELALRQGLTPFMVFLAAYAAALGRVAGQEDLIVGSAVANRGQGEVEGLIGFFVNILALRLDLSGAPSWREFLERVRRVSLEAFDHQAMPFERLVAALAPDRSDLSQPALRQVGFTYVSDAGRDVQLPGLEVRPLAFDRKSARLDVTLVVRTQGETFHGELEYSTELFKAATMERFAGFLTTLLKAMVEAVEEPVPALPPLVDHPAPTTAEAPGTGSRAAAAAATDATAAVAVVDPVDAAVARLGAESNLTDTQSLFWFTHKLKVTSQLDFERVTALIAIERDLDPELFRIALQGVVDRADILRSRFGEVDGVPLREVVESMPVELAMADFSAEPSAEERRAAIHRWAEARAAIKTDFADRLFDFGLVRMGPEEHVFYLSIHHIIIDAFSISVIFRRASEHYTLLEAGELGQDPRQWTEEQSPPLASYQDFVDYEKGLRQTPRWPRAEKYWREKLALPFTPTRFYRRGTETALQAVRHTVKVDTQLTAALKAMAAREGFFSPAVLFATVFYAYIARLHGPGVWRLGTTYANRPSQFLPMVGLSMVTCPMQTEVAAGDSWDSLARKVQLETVGTARFQFYPVRNPPTAPIFDAYINYQSATFPEFGGAPAHFELPTAGFTRHNLDLMVSDFDGEGRFRIDFDFNVGAFDAVEQERSLGHFLTLLRSLVENVQLPIARAPMLSATERRQLLEWSAEPWTAPPLDGRAGLLHALAEAQAARTPDAPALLFDGEALSFGALDRRANALAHRLRALGVGPESRVGVAMHRAFELWVALLGVLKAGGAYVPLDPSYPRERLAYMMDDAGISVVLTHGPARDELPEVDPAAVTVLLLDGFAEQAETPPASGVTPENLAYLIYTSGSTGLPKGVMIPHRQIATRVLWGAETDVKPGNRYLAKTSISFDISVAEIFVPLATGATAIVARPGGQRDAAYLVRLMAREGVTNASIPPSQLRMVLEQPQLAECTALELMLCGAEAFPAELAERFQKVLPIRVENRYGPTETTISVTTWPVRRGKETGIVPIGRPTNGSRIYLVDAADELLPPGIPGELLIGGPAVGRGYLDRPSLTAERFVPDPFGDEAGGRLYRTGDLARFTSRDPDPQGARALEFLGRIDHQIKIRGFRVELGEIEAFLHQAPGIAEATVLDRKGEDGDLRLVAFVVSRDGEPPVAEELAAFLAERVPEYMVPATFQSLPALPRLPNGKVDRKALEGLEVQAESSREYVAPRTPTEGLLVAMWADLLDLPRESLGARDDFFALGGHSLLATQVISRVRETFGVELPLRVLFEGSVLEDFARAIDTAVRTQKQGEIPAMVPTARWEEDGATRKAVALPLSFSQQRMWFLDQFEPDSPFYNVPSLFRIRGKLDMRPFVAAMTEIVRRHEALRTRFLEHHGKPTQVIDPPFRLAIPVLDVTALPEARRQAVGRDLLVAELRRPFRLATGPLVRALCVRFGAEDHGLCLTLHHIVSDGWSIGILMREFSALYHALVAGKGLPQESPLEELPLQYPDFAVWQRQWLSGEVLERQIAHWRSRLEGAPAVLELPTDRPRPAVQSFRGQRTFFAVGDTLTEQLHALGRDHGTTVFMTVLAAWATLLSRHSGQRQVVVGSPVAGRNRVEIEGLIGFFVNSLALATNLEDEPTTAALLQRTREVTLDAYAHQDLPFEKLVEELSPERDLGHAPIFQVMFELQNAPSKPFTTVGLKLEPMEYQLGISRYDLTLSLTEKRGGLWGWIQYASDLFDATTVERMIRRLRTLMEGMVARPEVPVSHLPLLPRAERHQVLVEVSDTVAPVVVAPGAAATIHGQVAHRAAAQPEKTAVIFGDETVAYGDLLRQARAVAQHLRRRGVTRGDRVAVALDRSPRLVVALLGVLEAGAAYVPLDPTHPRQRLAYVLEDCGARVLLTEGELAEAIGAPEHPTGDGETPTAAGPAVVRLEDLDPATVEAADLPAVEATDAAYVIYTSGSTGRPKGVEVSHGAVVNFLATMARRPGMTADDTLLAVTTISFDIAGLELYLPLVVGGTVCLASRETAADGLALLQLLETSGTTVLQATPATWRLLLAAGWEGASEETGGLKALCGGEALPPDLAAALLPRLGEQGALWNVYGPTETTIWSTIEPLHPVAEDDGSSSAVPTPISIGRPIGNTSIHLLDRALEPAPVGVPGELTIGGLGVARGYLGRPALTAEKFVPDPFGTRPGARLYRTGDLARMLSDGRLLFLGRGDHQVKVRGFRIELGEIEAQLNADPRVAQGAVVAVSEGGGEARLVAYLVPAPSLGEGAEEGAGEDFAVESLRDGLRRELPEYMIPTFLIPLDSMPLNPSGKIDRRALMERKLTAGAALGAAAEFVAPRSPVEQVLANMYGDLLSVQQVGVHDNFFALGGHSLLATQLMAWIRDDFEVELPLRSLFEAPTVAGLAAVLLADPDQREAVEEVAPLLLEIAEMSEDEVAMEMEKMTDVDESGEDGGAE